MPQLEAGRGVMDSAKYVTELLAVAAKREAEVAKLEKELRQYKYWYENAEDKNACYTKQNREMQAACAKYKKRIAELEGSCPCEHTEPCSPNCTCIHPISSCGCSRCCRYGSKAQKMVNAERLSALEK